MKSNRRTMADALGRGTEVLFVTTLVGYLVAALLTVGSTWFVFVVPLCAGIGTVVLALVHSLGDAQGSSSDVFGDGHQG